MRPIENIRRDLRTHAWMKHSSAPFAGTVHDFSRPLRKRFEQRQYTGPYYWSPSKPGTRRGFYQASHGLACDKAGSSFNLRLELANDHLWGSRLRFINGYYADRDHGDTLTPIVARLPHGRGFLAGWTMGAGMCAALDSDIYETIEDAARAAHDIAESDANDACERDEDDDSDE
jgi:hypothetical protein